MQATEKYSTAMCYNFVHLQRTFLKPTLHLQHKRPKKGLLSESTIGSVIIYVPQCSLVPQLWPRQLAEQTTNPAPMADFARILWFFSTCITTETETEVFGLHSWHSAQTTHKAPLETLRGFETRGSWRSDGGHHQQQALDLPICFLC